MTYHSEPISSLWNRVPGNMSRTANSVHMDMPDMTPEGSSMSTKTAQ